MNLKNENFKIFINNCVVVSGFRQNFLIILNKN